MYGIQTSSKEIAIATMITLWIFKCRDSGKSPAMGIKTWDYLNSSIKNSAIPSRTVNDYIEQLSKRLIANPNPKTWVKLTHPESVIQRLGKNGEIIELSKDQSNLILQFESPESLISSYAKEGITEKKIIDSCRKYPHVIATFVRVKHEELKDIISGDE